MGEGCLEVFSSLLIYAPKGEGYKRNWKLTGSE